MITNDIEQKVKNEILELADLPEEGIVAGQFVASLFFKHLDLPLNRPMNDIDIFVNKKQEHYVNNSFRVFRHKNRLISQNPSKFHDHLRSAFFRGYSIVKSYMLDNKKSSIPINIITTNPTHFIKIDNFLSLVEKDHQASREKEEETRIKYADITPEMIINNFDINCCAVAYNIETETFHYTDAFCQFLSDFKLRVTSAHAPHSTLLRLTKKVKELNCNPDINDEINFFKLYKTIFSKSYSIIRDFKYGHRFLEIYNKEKTPETDALLEFNNYSFVGLKSFQNEIINCNKGFEDLHEIYKKMEPISELHETFVRMNFMLNLYYSSIGVLKHGETNLEYIRDIIDKKENSSLALNWMLGYVSNLPFGNYNLKDIEKEIPISIQIEDKAHLAFSLISHFESPADMEEFAKNFVDEKGNFNHVKAEYFKYQYATFKDIKDSKFNVSQYKPKKVIPFVSVITNQNEAIYCDIFNNFAMQYFMNRRKSDVKEPVNIFYFKIGKKIKIPFFIDKKEIVTGAFKSKQLGFSSPHSFYYSKYEKLTWEKIKITELFKDIEYLNGNDEDEARLFEENLRKFRFLIMFFISATFYFSDYEFTDKNDRKNMLIKRIQFCINKTKKNIRRNKRIISVRPYILLNIIRKYFQI